MKLGQLLESKKSAKDHIVKVYDERGVKLFKTDSAKGLELLGGDPFLFELSSMWHVVVYRGGNYYIGSNGGIVKEVYDENDGLCSLSSVPLVLEDVLVKEFNLRSPIERFVVGFGPNVEYSILKVLEWQSITTSNKDHCSLQTIKFYPVHEIMDYEVLDWKDVEEEINADNNVVKNEKNSDILDKWVVANSGKQVYRCNYVSSSMLNRIYVSM